MPIIGQRMLSEFRMTAPETSYKAALAAFEDGCERATAVFESIDEVLAERMGIIKKQVDEQEEVVIKQLNKVSRIPVKKLSIAESHFMLRLCRIKNVITLPHQSLLKPHESAEKSRHFCEPNIRRINYFTNINPYIYMELDSSLVSNVNTASRFMIFSSLLRELMIPAVSEFERLWVFGDPFRVCVDVNTLKSVSSIKNPTDDSKKLENPWGIASHPNGNIYIVEITRNRVFVVDANLKYLRTLEKTASGQENLFKEPASVAVSRSGLVGVIEYGNKRITLFDENDNVLKIIPDPKHPLFSWPIGIAFDSKENIYVADIQEKNIIKVTLKTISPNVPSSSTNFDYTVEKFEVPPEFTQSGFSSLIVNQYDEVYATTSRGSHVYMFSSDGKFIRTINVPPYTDVCCMTFGPSDGFTLSSRSSNKMYFFDREGSMIHELDYPKSAGVAFGVKNRLYAISQEAGTLTMYSA